MGKVKSWYERQSHSEPMGGLCDGECGNCYYIEDLNETCYNEWLCNDCMFIFMREQEEQHKIEDHNE